VERIKKKGVALIAVIVTIVLFTSLILAVVLAATMSIRRANYYKDKLIALEIAETGLQKILYNLNYYGYQENNTGTGWSKASWIGSNFKSSSFSLPQWYSDLIKSKGLTENDLTKYETEISLPEYGGKGKYTLYFIDANSQTASETDLDLIVAKGSYRGRTATISFLLRGAGEIQMDNSGNYFYGDFKNSLGVQPVKNPNRTLGTCGIPEAFNKHVIYADTLAGNGTVAIKGNITCKNYNFTGSYTTQSETTLTETNIDFMNYLPRVETSLYISDIPSPPSSYSVYFISPPGHTNEVWGFLNEYTGRDTVVSYPANPPNGTSYNSTTSDYTFTNTQITYSFKVWGDANSNGTPSQTANLTLNGTNTISNACYVTNNLTINGTLNTTNSTIFRVGGDLTINSGTIINGDFVCILDSPSSINITSITINDGSFVLLINGGTNPDINISGITINGASSNYKSAIIIYDNSTNGAVINPISIDNIIINANGKTKIFVYSKRSVSLNVQNNLSDNTINETPAVIIYGEKEAKISIASGKQVNGSIYCVSNSTTNTEITLNSNSKVINGVLITNGTININNGVSITYDKSLFPVNSDAYRGFLGGRRKYLPVPGSWRIEW
jgi:hypothetical protein